MPTLDESTGHASINARGLRLAFRWAGDRWTHALELGDGPAPRPVVAALEGMADPTRVVSPAFQQIHFQHAPDDPEAIQALLVGQGGPHHFSAVFTVRETPEAIRVEVEVADRCREEIAALASTYVVDLPSSRLREAGTSAVSWNLGPERPGTLAIEVDPPDRLDLREAGRRGAHVQAAARVEPGRPTVAWSYRWLYRRSP